MVADISPYGISSAISLEVVLFISPPLVLAARFSSMFFISPPLSSTVLLGVFFVSPPFSRSLRFNIGLVAVAYRGLLHFGIGLVAVAYRGLLFFGIGLVERSGFSFVLVLLWRYSARCLDLFFCIFRKRTSLLANVTTNILNWINLVQVRVFITA